MTEVQRYLCGYGELCDEVKEIKEKLMVIRGIAEYKSPCGGTGGSGGVSDKVGSNAARIADLESRLKCKQVKLFRLRDDIIRRISRLDNPRQRKIITDRYIKRKSWEDIASENGICERWAFRLHKKGLEEINSLFSEHRLISN